MTTKKHHSDEPVSMERRRFLELSAKYGFTAAVVAGASGALLSSEAAAQTAKEERDRQKAAKARHDGRGPRTPGRFAELPDHAIGLQGEHPERHERQGLRQARTGGQLGAGGALAQKVQNGTIQAAQHSLSNFAPFAPVVEPHQPALFLRRQSEIRQSRELGCMAHRR